MGENSSHSKKIRGKLLETMQDEPVGTKLLVDTVFSGKVEVLFDESSEGVIPDVGTWVNVVHSLADMPVIMKIWSDSAESSGAASAQEPSVPQSPKKQVPKGPVRTMRGEVISVNISDTPSGRFGSLTLKINETEVNLIVGNSSKGEIPPVGTYLSIDFEDTKVPRVLQIERTDDTSPIEPIYTPVPSAPWFVRWPVACMFCGETDVSKLKYKEQMWTTDIGKPKVVEGTETTVLKILNGILISAFTPYPGVSQVSRKKKYLSVSLPILMYTCKDCSSLRVGFEDCMDISLEPIDSSRLRYNFTFESSKYEEYFRDHNPVDIEPKIDVLER